MGGGVSTTLSESANAPAICATWFVLPLDSASESRLALESARLTLAGFTYATTFTKENAVAVAPSTSVTSARTWVEPPSPSGSFAESELAPVFSHRKTGCEPSFELRPKRKSMGLHQHQH